MGNEGIMDGSKLGALDGRGEGSKDPVGVIVGSLEGKVEGALEIGCRDGFAVVGANVG